MDSKVDANEFARAAAKAVGYWRHARGLTQPELAERLHVSSKMVAKIESGRHDMRLSTLYRLATALDVSPAEILRTDRDMPILSPRKARSVSGLAATGWRRAARNVANAIPILNLSPRAGIPSNYGQPFTIAHAIPPTGRHPREEGLFLAQVHGNSMEPRILDRAWCLFSRHVGDTDWLDRIALVRDTDESGQCAFVLKRITGVRLNEQGQRVLQLSSQNKDFPLLELAEGSDGYPSIVALLREVLTPAR